MQLVFQRKDEDEITAFIEKNGEMTEYSYNEMIINKNANIKSFNFKFSAKENA